MIVNFGTPPHYLGLQKLRQKVPIFATKLPELAKIGQTFVFSFLLKMPLEMEVAPGYTLLILLTLFSLFILFKVLHTA